MTTIQRRKMMEMVVGSGLPISHAAEEVGVPYSTAFKQFQKAGIKSRKSGVRRYDQLKQYAAYDRKTEELVAMGTAREVAAVCGIEECTFRSALSRGGGKYEYVRLEEETV